MYISQIQLNVLVDELSAHKHKALVHLEAFGLCQFRITKARHPIFSPYCQDVTASRRRCMARISQGLVGQLYAVLALKNLYAFSRFLV